MSAVLFSLVLLAFIPHAILGGIGIDRLLVQIPGWYRVGPQAFATYARAMDLANGTEGALRATNSRPRL